MIFCFSIFVLLQKRAECDQKLSCLLFSIVRKGKIKCTSFPFFAFYPYFATQYFCVGFQNCQIQAQPVLYRGICCIVLNKTFENSFLFFLTNSNSCVFYKKFSCFMIKSKKSLPAEFNPNFQRLVPLKKSFPLAMR